MTKKEVSHVNRWGGFGYLASQLANYDDGSITNKMVIDAFVDDFFEGCDWSDINEATTESITGWTQWEDRKSWIYWHWVEDIENKVLAALAADLEYRKSR